MKRFFSATLAVLMIAAAVAAAVPASASSPFDDVKETRWSYSSVNYAVTFGYMKGTGERKFSPSGTLTRAMVATVLWRRQGEPAAAAPSGFSDVPDGKWYSDAVAWAKETGVVQGVSASKFKPDDNVTREQLAAMLFRYSSSAPVCVTERADLGAFPDGAAVSGWAREAMAWAVEAALVKGSSDGSLDPTGFATREQFAAIIERFDKTFKLEYNEPAIRSHYSGTNVGKADDADFFIAPDGDDSADGSFEHPFRTMDRAVSAVRELKKTKTGDVTVAFMAGTYDSLSVNLTKEDSGSPDQRITYRAYGDGPVVFEGGFVFGEDDFEPLTSDEAAMFDTKSAPKIRKIGLGGKVSNTASLRIYGENGLLNVARYPNMYPDGSDQLFDAAITMSETTMKLIHPFLRKRLNVYADTTDLKIYGFLTYGWYKETLSFGEYDPETHIFTVPDSSSSYFAQLSGAPGLRYEVLSDGTVSKKDDVRFAFVNMPEDLDNAGEYLVRGDTLYVYDPHGEYVIPQTATTIHLNNADDITVSGLTFIGSADAPIRARESCRFHLEDCTFRVTSGNEFVVIDLSRKGEDLDFHLTGCDFEMAPMYAVRVHPQHEGAGRFEYPVTGVYDNNRFAKIGVGTDGGIALFLRDHESAQVTHNEFEDCSRSAVQYGGCMHLRIEYNVFRRCMYNSEDGGVIYCGNDREEYDNVVRYNIFFRTGWYGIYIDDGGGGVEAYSNIFYHVGCAAVIHDGRGNSIHDNVLISSGVTVTREMYVNYLADLDSGDAVFDGSDGEGWRNFYKRWLSLFRLLEEDDLYREIVERERPELFELSTDPADARKAKFVIAPVNVVANNICIAYEPGTPVIDLDSEIAEFVDTTGNRTYPMDENPIFVNPTLGDYRLKDGADFIPIPVELIGRY